MTEEIAPADEAGAADKKKLTSDEWAECRALYELGEARTPELSDRFGVSKQAISRHFKENKVEYGVRKKEVEEKVAVAVTAAKASTAAAAVISFESTRKAKIEETKVESYTMARNIAIQTHKLLVEAQRSSIALATLQGDMKTLRMAAAIIGQTRQDRYAILNADKDIDPASLPELIIKDLSDQRIRDLQSAEAEEDFDPGDLPDELDEDDEIIETS